MGRDPRERTLPDGLASPCFCEFKGKTWVLSVSYAEAIDRIASVEAERDALAEKVRELREAYHVVSQLAYCAWSCMKAHNNESAWELLNGYIREDPKTIKWLTNRERGDD